MKSLAIFHVDLDGHGLSVVTQCMGLGFTDIECHDYHFDLEEGMLDHLREYDKIVVADLTLNEVTHRTLLAEGKDVQVYDHHDNEVNQYVNDLPNSILDHSRCGTKIFFEEYACKQKKRYPSLLKDFVELVNTYDLWQEDSPLWEEAFSLNRVLYKYTNYDEKNKRLAVKDFVDAMHKKIVSGANEWYWDRWEKQAIEQAREMESRRYTEALNNMTFRIDRRGMKFAVFMLPGKISYVAAKILKEFPYLDYCFVLNNWRGLSGKVSTRSSRGFICPSLASVNGHDPAAGGIIPVEDAKKFLSDVNWVPLYKDDPEFIADKTTMIVWHEQEAT